jgi:hypothetical protein
LVGPEDKYGHKEEDIIEEWRTLHIEDLHCLYHSINIIGFMPGSEIGRICSTHGGDDIYAGMLGISSQRRDHLEELSLYGNMELKQ